MAGVAARVSARVAGCLAGVVVTSAIVVACTTTDGLSSGSSGKPGPDVDAGDGGGCTAQLDLDHDNCGSCGNKCGDVQHCLAGKCAPGCPDHAVYVSADGNDNASGCSTTTPKRTIGAAIALLKTLGAQKHEVRVCRGTYDESVVLDYVASMSGGYECNTWKRSSGYGYPTFDSVNETIVTGTATTPAITVVGVQGVVIDGFTFRAKDGSTVRSAGAVSKDGAKPRFSNDKIAGGGGDIPASPASAGLVLDTGGSVEVSKCAIDGGRAKNTTAGGYGSAGIFLANAAGNAHVAESSVAGGAGIVAGGTGSVGILGLGGSLGGGGVERSTVSGGGGRTGVGSASYGIGFFTSSAVDVDVVSSSVHGGNGKCSGACSVNGIAVRTGGKTRIHGNRIHGGEVDPDLVDDIGFSGLRVSDYATADIQNNAVFSGNSTNVTFSSGATTLAIDSANGAAIVANNTLVVGPTATNKGSVIIAKSKNATIANNLLLDAGSNPSDRAVALDACQSRTYALHGNAWGGFADGTPLLRADTTAPGGGCTNDGINATTGDGIAAAAGGSFGGANVTGNVRVASTCGIDARCVPIAACTGSSACTGAMISGGWDLSTAAKLIDNGWKLPSTVSCAIAKGGVQVTGLLEIDAFSTPRTAPRSIGAHESDSCQ